MAEWQRVVQTTTRQFIRDEEVNTLRDRKLLALLKSKGRISFNHSGERMDWKVRYKQGQIQGYADNGSLTFPRQNRWITAELDWRGYASTDAVTQKEKLMNRNREAIIKVYSEIAELMMEEMKEQFCDELYIDGNAAGNENRLHGIESFMANSGAASGGYIGSPSDTYGGLVCTLGNYGGTWTGNWPAGTGDSVYDFWAPLIVDYTDTAWTAATKTWANTAIEALRYGILYTKKNRTKAEQIDLISLETDLYRQFLDLIHNDQRIIVNRGQDSALVKLGFQDVTNLDGTDITTEYGLPSGVGYGFNIDKMELRSLWEQLFVPVGPDWDIASMSYRFALSFFGNCRFNPRNQTKFMSIT